jgi:hypothetical protein
MLMPLNGCGKRTFSGWCILLASDWKGAPRRVADEEDVALSAFRSFCLGAQAGRFSKLVDAGESVAPADGDHGQQIVDLIRENNRQKRGGSGRRAVMPPWLSRLTKFR